MWYFAWILGTLLACAFGVITALALEHVEATKAGKKDQRAGNLAWFLADVGRLQLRYSRRGLPPACRSMAGDFLSAYR